MRKLILTTLALALLAVPAALQAQANTINATATIDKAFSYPAKQDLSWNTITPVGPSGNPAAAVTLAGGGTLGYVQVWTNTTTTVTTLNLTNAGLVGAVSGATITPTYTCGASATTAAPGALAACVNGATFTHTRGGSTNETYSVWFGGSIAGTAIDGAAADTYTGTITLTVTSQTI